MVIIEEKHDLFEVDEDYALVHCISLDCRMGAGIALEFDKRFPLMKPRLIEYINITKLNYPTCIGYNGYSRTLINLITKEHYYDKPTLNTLKDSLMSLKINCKKSNIYKLAMPKIGCGLDKLNWDDVKKIIEEVFNDLDIEILVCYL